MPRLTLQRVIIGTLLTEKRHITKPHLIGDTEVDTARGVIHIGVHRHDTDVILYRFPHRALHFIVITDSAQLTEDERSEEHTSELQSRQYLVCRLLLEKKNIPYSCLLPTS